MSDKDTICLVIPPSIFLLDERVFPSLGILKVAASLESAGYPVEVLDLSGISNYEEVVRLHVASSDARIYGLTITTPQMPSAYSIINAIRDTSPGCDIIAGGPHPTLISAAAKGEEKLGIKDGRGRRALTQLLDMVSVVVAGDGEDSIFEALRRIENSPRSSQLVDADDPKGSMFMTNQRYEQTPYPARHLIDLPSYHYTVDGYEATSVIAQLGCPFECGFCGGRQSSMLRRIRTRSTKSIVAELEHIYTTYGHRGFMFYDDELNVNKKLVELMDSISDLQDRLGVDFRLRGFVKAELFTKEQASAMKRAGFRQLLTGFESGSPRILTNINKKASRDDNTRAVEIAKNEGMKVKALMSIGHPGESLETIEETCDWLLQVRPEDFDCTIITTYPGTPYYDHAVKTAEGIWTYTYPKTGDRLHAYELDYNVTADYYKGDPDGGYKAYVFTDYISSDELVRARDALERDVRSALNIPFNLAAAAVNYEHSMGQLGLGVLRKSAPQEKNRKVRLNVVQ